MKGEKSNKIGRNDPRPCGRLKPNGRPLKYKDCHLNMGSESLNTPPRRYFHPASGIVFGGDANSLSLYERNTRLIEGIVSIFSINSKKNWLEIKDGITRDHVKELYRLITWLWPYDTDIKTLYPKPENKLRSLYLGWMRPESVLDSVVRYSLYCDEILVMNPFLNPWTIVEEYNPLVHPEDYVADTVKWLFFILQISPWILSGHVILLPHTADFDYKFRLETWKLAEERMKKKTKAEQQELVDDPQFKKYSDADFKRMWLSTPTEAMRVKIKDRNPELTEQQVQEMLDYVHKLKKSDPLYASNPNEKGSFGMHISSLGENLETGLYIAQITGSYLYTDFNWRWKEILSTAQETKNDSLKDWSFITHGFQKLDFKFLNNTTPQFANRIREEGRLASMRNFLRKTWLDISGNQDQRSFEQMSLNFKDELIEEYGKAEVEWEKIDKNLLKWVTGEGGVGSILTAAMDWKLPALGFAIGAIGNLISAQYNRKEYKKNVPLSVFVDLNRKR